MDRVIKYQFAEGLIDYNNVELSLPQGITKNDLVNASLAGDLTCRITFGNSLEKKKRKVKKDIYYYLDKHCPNWYWVSLKK